VEDFGELADRTEGGLGDRERDADRDAERAECLDKLLRLPEAERWPGLGDPERGLRLPLPADNAACLTVPRAPFTGGGDGEREECRLLPEGDADLDFGSEADFAFGAWTGAIETAFFAAVAVFFATGDEAASELTSDTDSGLAVARSGGGGSAAFEAFARLALRVTVATGEAGGLTDPESEASAAVATGGALLMVATTAAFFCPFLTPPFSLSLLVSKNFWKSSIGGAPPFEALAIAPDAGSAVFFPTPNLLRSKRESTDVGLMFALPPGAAAFLAAILALAAFGMALLEACLPVERPAAAPPARPPSKLKPSMEKGAALPKSTGKE